MNDNTVVNLDKVYKIYRGFIDDGLLEDRLEYGEEDLQSAYPFLNKEEVKYLYRLVQSNGDPGLVSSLDEVPAGLIKECLQESIHSGHDGWNDRDRVFIELFLADLRRYAFEVKKMNKDK